MIGIKIKETRTKRGLSQEDLAELSKVNLRTIQRIKNNETIPRDKTLKLIYDALDIVVIENDRLKIDKYLAWSSFLTVLVIISTFISWVRSHTGYIGDEKLYKARNGWVGTTTFNDYDLENWLLRLVQLR